MIAVIQRVTRASVTVDGATVSAIGGGLLILLGVAEGDSRRDAEVLADKIANLRIFSDSDDKMNLSLLTTGGAALVVSQFTLCANCVKGRRPDFFGAAKPDTANELYEYFCDRIKTAGVTEVKQGVFGADMKVELLNDGPVTIIINSGELKK
ncbi:D-aminoacyl-tRNA deacylase [Ruminococcus sp.]|uniref:D-aminoacyl-tRNA deacylase n=1 Tax=Ruminococcus sp. TaxID=41978 RepID=UPI003890EC27